MKRTILIALAVVCLAPAILKAEIDWICVTTTPEWTSRTRHASVVFDNKLWLLGGCTPAWPDTSRSDVGCSEDGATWTRVCDSAPWGPRCDFAAAVHNDSMWVLGGRTGRYSFFDDVWCSADGANWSLATDSAGWPARASAAVTTFDGKIWLMGGFDGGVFRDVWCSEDGRSWTRTGSSAPWSGRSDAALAVLRDTMWLMGGVPGTSLMPLNDVWCSADGDSWTEVTGAADWARRWGHAAVSAGGRLWVSGGTQVRPPPYYVNDVWWSEDGAVWHCDAQNAGWRPRGWHTAVVLRDTMWHMGGDSLFEQSLAIGEVWKGGVPVGIAEQRQEPVGLPGIGPSVARGVLLHPTGRSATLHDVTGRKVTDLEPGLNDIRHVAPGVYFIRRPETEDGRPSTAVRKVVIQR